MKVHVLVLWVIWDLDIWLSEAFVSKSFFASFLLIDILLASILMFLFSFPLADILPGCSTWHELYSFIDG